MTQSFSADLFTFNTKTKKTTKPNTKNLQTESPSAWQCSLSRRYNSMDLSKSRLVDSRITSESVSNTLMFGSNTQMKCEGMKANSGMQDPLSYASMHEL